MQRPARRGAFSWHMMITRIHPLIAAAAHAWMKDANPPRAPPILLAFVSIVIVIVIMVADLDLFSLVDSKEQLHAH